MQIEDLVTETEIMGACYITPEAVQPFWYGSESQTIRYELTKAGFKLELVETHERLWGPIMEHEKVRKVFKIFSGDKTLFEARGETGDLLAKSLFPEIKKVKTGTTEAQTAWAASTGEIPKELRS